MKRPTEDDLRKLRRALLESEWEKTRPRALRRLVRIANDRHPEMAPIALAGLATASYGAQDLGSCIYWCRQVIGLYPLTPSAVWSATLLSYVYRAWGMKRERFEAERERFKILRKIAFQSDENRHRAYALNELLKELKARDLSQDAEQCAEELRDVMKSLPPGVSRTIL